jgi:D-cysteine desulfhydrase family pyridoxal phosphate-dependent enzyme
MGKISDLMRNYPKAELSRTPTPIHKLSRISKYLGYNIYIMRDDLTGFGLGGNKTRKLDYIIGDAIAKKADILISKKASSFTRNAAVAGKIFGFEVHIVIPGIEKEHNQASRDFFKQFGANLHYTEDKNEENFEKKYLEIVQSLKKSKKNIYELHPGGSDSIGALGYLNAFQEINEYSEKNNIHFDSTIHATGSTGTQAGLILGQCISKYNTNNIGIAVSQKAEVQKKRIFNLTNETAKMLKVHFDESLIKVDDRFIGPGYAIPSEEGNNAVKIFSQMEGVMLDYVYTAKAAAGLIFYAKNNLFNKNDNILFIHTGGNSGFYY